MTFLNNVLSLLQSLFFTFFNLDSDNIFGIVIAALIVCCIFSTFTYYIFPKE